MRTYAPAVAAVFLFASAPVHRADAQAPPVISRTVIAAAKLPTVVGSPLYFKVVEVTLPSGRSSRFAGAVSVIYQLSGSTEVSLDGGGQILIAGQGVVIPEATKATLQAKPGGPAVFLHFILAPSAALDRPAETKPAIGKELYRTSAPIPDLKQGAYDLNLTRVIFPPQMPSNPPHHRSGAALYYILSGTGANTVGGKTESRPPGSLIYEPLGLVHQWGNPGPEPLAFLAFNINPEGTAAVIADPPPK